MTQRHGLPQVPGQCVESQPFPAPPGYGPGKQGAKTKSCSLTGSLAELGEKVIIPKRQRSSKKSPDGPTGDGGREETSLQPLESLTTNNTRVGDVYDADHDTEILIESFLTSRATERERSNAEV